MSFKFTSAELTAVIDKLELSPVSDIQSFISGLSLRDRVVLKCHIIDYRLRRDAREHLRSMPKKSIYYTVTSKGGKWIVCVKYEDFPGAKCCMIPTWQEYFSADLPSGGEVCVKAKSGKYKYIK